MDNLLAVNFHNQTLVAFEHDGQAYIAMRPVVDNMGLNWESQRVKLTERFGRRTQRITTRDTLGRQQEMVCLPLSVLPAFLFSITASKVKPELRETVIAYQDECTDVLYKHFFGAASRQAAALLDALFARHPGWRDTRAKYQAGLKTKQVASLQGKSASSVRGMPSAWSGTASPAGPMPFMGRHKACPYRPPSTRGPPWTQQPATAKWSGPWRQAPPLSSRW